MCVSFCEKIKSSRSAIITMAIGHGFPYWPCVSFFTVHLIYAIELCVLFVMLAAPPTHVEAIIHLILPHKLKINKPNVDQPKRSIISHRMHGSNRSNTHTKKCYMNRYFCRTKNTKKIKKRWEQIKEGKKITTKTAKALSVKKHMNHERLAHLCCVVLSVLRDFFPTNENLSE